MQKINLRAPESPEQLAAFQEVFPVSFALKAPVEDAIAFQAFGLGRNQNEVGDSRFALKSVEEFAGVAGTISPGDEKVFSRHRGGQNPALEIETSLLPDKEYRSILRQVFIDPLRRGIVGKASGEKFLSAFQARKDHFVFQSEVRKNEKI